MTPMQPPLVTEIRLDRAERQLHLTFGDGVRFSLGAEYLRVLSPSAEVQGHGPGQAVTVPAKRAVAIAKVEAVGNYAIRIVFDDGHDTGIYSWAYLRELGEGWAAKWQTYLDAMARDGLSRDA